MYLLIMFGCFAYVALMAVGLTWAGCRAAWRALFPRKVVQVQPFPWQVVQRLDVKFWPRLN